MANSWWCFRRIYFRPIWFLFLLLWHLETDLKYLTCLEFHQKLALGKGVLKLEMFILKKTFMWNFFSIQKVFVKVCQYFLIERWVIFIFPTANNSMQRLDSRIENTQKLLILLFKKCFQTFFIRRMHKNYSKVSKEFISTRESI